MQSFSVIFGSASTVCAVSATIDSAANVCAVPATCCAATIDAAAKNEINIMKTFCIFKSVIIATTELTLVMPPKATYSLTTNCPFSGHFRP